MLRRVLSLGADVRDVPPPGNPCSQAAGRLFQVFIVCGKTGTGSLRPVPLFSTEPINLTRRIALSVSSRYSSRPWPAGRTGRPRLGRRGYPDFLLAPERLVSGAAEPTPHVGFRWFFAWLQRSVAKGKRTLTPLPPARRHDLTVSPRRRARGIKREHGEDDPIGAETVAAPATVSGCRSSPRWSSDRRGGPPGHPGAMPLRNAFGRPAGRQMIGATSASQETCRRR